METIIFIASLQILLAVIWYKTGYDKRESEFQNNPVQFSINGKIALWVGRESGGVKVRIYEKELVEVITPNN